jgi:hypothetical protein
MRASALKLRRELIGALRHADDGASVRIIAEMPAMSRWLNVDGDARAHQIGDDAGLQVGEGEHESGSAPKSLECPRR